MTRFIPQFKVRMAPDTPELLAPVFESGYIGQGPKVEEFEHELFKMLDTRYGLTVNSGTSALWLALHLIGVRPGDFVISTPMTCSATNEVIALMGAQILWADVDMYGNIDPGSVWDLVRFSTSQMLPLKAIMVVDWGGLPCDYDGLREAAGGIPIVEDAAHAFMATYKGQSIAASGGDYVAYSFQAIKHLTTGDGGFLVTPPEQYQRAKLLRWYGLDRTGQDAMRCRQDIPEPGFKFHMNDINATIGLANLDGAEASVEWGRKIAQIYDNTLMGKYLRAWPEDRESSFWLYTIHVNQPLRFEAWMKTRGIGVSQTHNRNDEYSFLWNYRRDLPNLDRFFSTMVCIPIGWWLDLDDVDYIINNVLEWQDNHG